MASAALNLMQLRAAGAARWKTLAPRERIGATIALAVLAIALLWLVVIGPAWRVVGSAPATIERLDAQLSQMQRLAGEAIELKSSTPVGAAQSATALRSATDQLGERGKLVVLGDRATLTLSGASSAALRQWLAEARSGARARPVEAQLTRSPQGYSGTIVVTFGGGA